MSRSISIEVLLGGEVLKLPLWVVRIFFTVQSLEVGHDQIEVEALPSYQFLQVVLDHIRGLRVLITDDGDDRTLLSRQLEAVFLQTVLRDEVKGTQRVFHELIIRVVLIVALAGIIGIPEKGFHLFLDLFLNSV